MRAAVWLSAADDHPVPFGPGLRRAVHVFEVSEAELAPPFARDARLLERSGARVRFEREGGESGESKEGEGVLHVMSLVADLVGQVAAQRISS